MTNASNIIVTIHFSEADYITDTESEGVAMDADTAERLLCTAATATRRSGSKTDLTISVDGVEYGMTLCLHRDHGTRPIATQIDWSLAWLRGDEIKRFNPDTAGIAQRITALESLKAAWSAAA